MEVWVLEWMPPYSTSEIKGVYETKELAEAAKQACPLLDQTNMFVDPYPVITS